MLLRLVPICAAAILFVSACCKGYCRDEDVTFLYRNFVASEIDTVQYLFYLKDNLNTPVDSMLHVYFGTNTTPQDLRTTVPVNFDRVIEVRIKSLQDTLRITNIKTEKAECQCDKGTYRRMKSFTIDGTEIVAREVEVIR